MLKASGMTVRSTEAEEDMEGAKLTQTPTQPLSPEQITRSLGALHASILEPLDPQKI